MTKINISAFEIEDKLNLIVIKENKFSIISFSEFNLELKSIENSI